MLRRRRASRGSLQRPATRSALGRSGSSADVWLRLLGTRRGRRRRAVSLPALGFAWIVVPVSTERMRYDRAGAAAVIAAAKRHGLATRIAPLGSRRHLRRRGDRRGWPHAIRDVGLVAVVAHELRADAMFWDEPHGHSGSAGYVRGDDRTNPRRRAVPLHQPGSQRLARAARDDVTRRHRHRCYRSPAVALARLPGVRQRYGLPVHVWVRSFGLSRRQASRPANDLSTLLDAGVTDIRIWGFPPAGCSCLDNAEPQRDLEDHGDDRAPRRSPGGRRRDRSSRSRGGKAWQLAASARRPGEPWPYWQYPRIQERPNGRIPRSETHCPP